MKLADATLDLAKHIQEVIISLATGGSTSTIADTTLTISGEYVGGSYWILTGSNAGKYGMIKNVSANLITLDQTLAQTVAAGNQYAIAVKDFPLRLLKMAINTILATYPVVRHDDTLTADTTIEEYTLPAGVSDIRRVEIAANDSAPYRYEISHRWKEMPGKLIYLGNYVTGDDGKKIRLTYVTRHGDADDLTDIDQAVSPEYLRAAAMVFIWRSELQRTHRDNPVAMDLFNEAKMLEAQTIVSAFRKESSLPPRDARFA